MGTWGVDSSCAGSVPRNGGHENASKWGRSRQARSSTPCSALCTPDALLWVCACKTRRSTYIDVTFLGVLWHDTLISFCGAVQVIELKEKLTEAGLSIAGDTQTGILSSNLPCIRLSCLRINCASVHACVCSLALRCGYDQARMPRMSGRSDGLGLEQETRQPW